MKRIIFFILATFFISFTQAQPGIDSLIKITAAENNVSRKIDGLIQIASAYNYINPDSSLRYANAAIKLLKPLNDSVRIVNAELYTSNYYYNTGKPDTALSIAQKNINWLQRKPSQLSLLAQYYSFSGLCYMKMDRQKEALGRFYLALQKAEAGNDDLTRGKAYVNIGWAMMELNQFEQAIAKFHTAIYFLNEKKLPERYLITIYNNLGSCYGSLNKTDSAYMYAQMGVAIAHKFGNITGEANGLFILGTAQQKKGQYNDALQTFLKAQPLRKKINDPFYTVSDLAEMSSLYAKLGRTKEGISTGEEALKIAEKENISAKLPMIYSSLAENYEAANDFQKSAFLYRKMNRLKDSLYADANPKALAEMQTKYETEKSDRLIEQQHNRIVLQNYLFIGIAGLVILASLLLFSVYKRNKLRQETLMKTQLMKQQEAAVKAVMEAEENERQRIAKDLHDGIGQMMSAAKMNLSAIESEINFSNPEQKKSFSKIINLLDESCKEVRTVSHIMMPNALLKNNLGIAIHDFADKISSKNLKVHVSTEGLDERIDSNIETVLYRVIQECVNNVIKHSDATTLDISLIRDKDGISGTIEDNGKGFDMTDNDQSDGIGLKNIFSRIEYLKGTVDFDSAPGRGTVVALNVPNPLSP